jgi:hypothetical protein
MSSPYEGIPVELWKQKTRELIYNHPLNTNELYEVVLTCWQDIFQSTIGSKPFRIGTDILPTPQVMGFLLHELIALELAYRYPQKWRRDQTSAEKDLVYIPDDVFSIEIKTSSSVGNIYGNRSYSQTGTTSKKTKSGYYLAINFGKFSSSQTQPTITQVRFGWLDYTDWVGQASATGQQARLSPDIERNKLLKLPLTE